MTTTDQQKLEHFITCLTAVKEGKTVEYDYAVKGWDSANHIIDGERLSSFEEARWRVEPDAPKVRPHTFETAPDSVKVRRKSNGETGCLSAWPDGVTFGRNASEEFTYTYASASEFFELLDGRPYGIEQKEESEWPKWAEDNEGDIWAGDEEEAHFVFVKQRGYKKEEDHRPWANVMRSFMAVEIPTAEASRIIESAKGVTK